MNSTTALRGPTLEEIVALTFHLYVNTGCPEGTEWKCWREAEKELKRRYSINRIRTASGPAEPALDETLASLVADFRGRMANRGSKAAPAKPATNRPARPARAEPQTDYECKPPQ